MKKLLIPLICLLILGAISVFPRSTDYELYDKIIRLHVLANSNSKEGKNTLAAGTGVFGFLAAATASGSDSFKANGSANNTNSASGNVTVTVVEVRDNGNMVVEGTQSIWNNKNEHKITVRGVVRPDDISYNNTILSNKVADATLRFDGKGPLNAKQRQGILTQIFNILF